MRIPIMSSLSRRRLLQMAGVGALVGSFVPQVVAQDAFGQAILRGAGSTFVMPLMRQWIVQYRAAQPNIEYTIGGSGLDDDLLGRAALDYEATGSLAGLLRLQAKAVDFALSEIPLSPQALAEHGLIQIPIVSGGVAIVTHVPGIKDSLHIDGKTLAAVFRGSVTRWNDTAITALNPGVALPDAAIVPIHRTDGSGTTYTVTRYLATQDTSWRETIGVDAVVRWPVGTAVRGSSGVAQALASTPGSIGYLDAVQAEASGLGIARLKNKAGQFVPPSAKAVEAATQSIEWQADQNSQPQFIDAPGQASYPIVATVLAVLNAEGESRQDLRARAFLAWALANGQETTRELGYVALPSSVAQHVRAQLLPAQSG